MIAFYDDNFGDMLIRTCFTSLLRTVLHNLQMEESQYTITQMPLKSVELEKIEQTDLIFFAGGGLFGLSYLDFYDYMAEIVETAEKKQIPVVFSSIGANNMDATEENEAKLFSLLQKSCIKAISVRENAELFQKYLGERDLKVQQVCDPAVWTKEVYSRELPTSTASNNTKCIGINVVRGGLFEANGLAWKLKDEVEYLAALKDHLENAGFDYRFYTNGSLLDDNAMRFFAREKEIPEEKLIFVHSSPDLVRAIAGFDAVAAIRMHSSILSYSFQIPTVNLIWNDKIQHFYNNIGYPDRAILVENWTAEYVAERLTAFLQETPAVMDTSYRMTLYTFLFDFLSEMLKPEKSCHPYTFEEVKSYLSTCHPAIEEELTDVRYKIQRGEGHYLARFYEIREKNRQIKTLTKENEKLNKKVEKQEQTIAKKQETIEKNKETIEKHKVKIEEQKQTINAQKQTIETQKQTIEKHKETIEKHKETIEKHKSHLRKVQEELNQIYHSIPGRIYKKLKKMTTSSNKPASKDAEIQEPPETSQDNSDTF